MNNNLGERCTNLDHLSQRTRKDPGLMMQMISLYLEQTPVLISAMNQSMMKEDWNGLHMAAHRMIPSFSIMGIHTDFVNLAKKVQEYAIKQEHAVELDDMVSQLDHICSQACRELKGELMALKAQADAP